MAYGLAAFFLQRAIAGFPVPGVPCFVTLGWCFTPVSVRAITMFLCTTWPEHVPFWALPINRFGKLCMTTLLSHLHSLSIVTCSTGLSHRFATYRLSFPLQTRVCQTHAWGWCFYSTAWRVRLSLTGTLSCQSTETLPLIPCILRYNFERTGRTHSVHPTLGFCGIFGHFSPTSQTLSTPAPARVPITAVVKC